MVSGPIAKIREVGSHFLLQSGALVGAPPGCVAPGKSRHFMAIAARGHGAPAPAAGARRIVEEKAALGVGTGSKGRACAFRYEFRSRAGDGGKEPIQSALPGNKFEAPISVLFNEFIVPFGDAQNLVD
jgi:hypothetical protein